MAERKTPDNLFQRLTKLFRSGPSIKRKVKDSGIMFELKERSFYKKPSALKREQKNKAKLRTKYEKLKNQED